MACELKVLIRDAVEDADYVVVEPREPKLYKEMFPWSKPPVALFDNVRVPMEIPDELWITDTTFRDGQQAREPYTVEQMVKLYELLHELGGPNGRILHTEFFLYTSRDREAVRKVRELGYEYPKVTSWIRASKSDLRLVKEEGVEETGILASISDYHIYYKLKLSRSQAIEKYLEVAEEALKNGIIPRLHLEDVTRADVPGCVVPFLRRALSLSEKYGLPVKIRLSDTLCMGLPWPEAKLPRSIPKLIWVVRKIVGFPAEWVEFHGHNDFFLGAANAMAAWLYGASMNNGTLLGIGERAGNIPIEALVFLYAQIKGSFDGMNPKVLVEIARFYEEELGFKVPDYYPILGRNFPITRAGIHLDGLLKNPEIYLPFDVEKVLGIKPGVKVTSYSGLAGIAYWINTFFNLEGEEAVDKKHPAVQKIYEEEKKIYENGRVTPLTDEEMLRLVEKHMPWLLEKLKQRKR